MNALIITRAINGEEWLIAVLPLACGNSVRDEKQFPQSQYLAYVARLPV